MNVFFSLPFGNHYSKLRQAIVQQYKYIKTDIKPTIIVIYESKDV